MDLFKVHKLSNVGIEKAMQIQSAYDVMVAKVIDYIHDDRCKAIMLTKLEESSFYAKKGMAMDKRNQEKEGL